MIKGINLHGDDIPIAADMIRVAGITGLCAGQWRLPVKALLGVAVFTDLIVTVQAQIAHRRFFKGGVAILTLSLELSVPRNHFAGH